ncbi:hypothetical protein SDC9_182089 [bioreactor metagenome]|uniref:Uncharacterized protein n=1 Tax=bioreactor metagenome TaxID=1076179 RepID=A0A645H6I4_9ZZZZ
MEMDGNSQLVFQRLDQLAGGVGLEQSRHIFNAKLVHSPALQFFSHIDIIIQGIFVPFGISNIAGVADGAFSHFAGFQHLFDGQLHTGQPVETVKDTKYIDAAGSRLPDERADHVVRVVGIAYGIGPPQQHLK